jgi:hypothetical protein
MYETSQKLNGRRNICRSKYIAESDTRVNNLLH